MIGFPTHEQVEQIKENFPVGTVVKINSMQDPYRPIPRGTLGEVTGVDDVGSILMKWQNGQGLSLLPYEDDFDVISRPDEQEQNMGMTME